MQTFKQFVEAREVKNIPQNDIREILTHIEEHFFYEKDNEFVFDLGNNVKLTADNLNDLAKKIYQNKYFLRRLKELYRANV